MTDDMEKSSNPMQEAVRAGVRRADGSYQTNAGTVWTMSPQDQRRAHLAAHARVSRYGGGSTDFDTAKAARMLAADPELDIDWGRYGSQPFGVPRVDNSGTLHELSTMEDRVMAGDSAFYGRCRGGPYNTNNLVHSTEEMMVAIDRFSGKPTPAVQRTPETDETFRFGWYRWNETSHEWDWDDPQTVNPVGK